MSDIANTSNDVGGTAARLRRVGDGWPDCGGRPRSGMAGSAMGDAGGDANDGHGGTRMPSDMAAGEDQGAGVTSEQGRTSSRDRAGVVSGLPVLPPLVALVELAGVIGLILLVDWALPDIDLADIQPNPLWLPVLLLSLQYGTVSGLMAALVAIVVTVVSGFPEEGVGENHFSYVLRIWSQPILWIGAAVLLGQLRLRQITERQELMRHAEELAVERDNLARYSAGMRQRCEMLERERAGAVDAPAVALLQSVAALPTAAGDVGEAFRRCMTLAFPGAEASVFAVTATGARKVGDSGWRADQRWRDELARDHPLYRAVIDDGASPNVLVPGDEARLAGEGLAAVPIRSTLNRRVIGMVKIERAPAALICAETTAALDVVAAALLPALEPGEPRLLTLPAHAPAAGPWRKWRSVRWRAVQPARDALDGEIAPEQRVRPRMVR